MLARRSLVAGAERLRTRTGKPSVPAAACVASASVGRSGDWEISGNGMTTMCCWCYSSRRVNSVTARRRAISASTPCNETPQLWVEKSIRRGGSQQPCERAASCKGSRHDGRRSEFTADTSAEPYRMCATEELRNAALWARNKGPYPTLVRSRGPPLRRLEEATRAEPPPRLRALPKSRHHEQITLVDGRSDSGAGLSCTTPFS